MKKRHILMTALGLLAFAAGLVLLRTVGVDAVLPYVCIGLGTGAFGYGMGELLRSWSLKGDPALEKQLEIEQNDERNVALSNRAKGRAYDLMVYLFGALMVAFALMGVDLAALLLLVAAYLVVVGCFVVSLYRYHRAL